MHSELSKIILKRFSKIVDLSLIESSIFIKRNSTLFRKEHYNEYCFLEYTKGSESYSITIFKSDYKSFEKIENDFDDGISFCVNEDDLKIIMNCIV